MIVVKVGGSLFDLPELGPRLRSWLPTLEAKRVLLVPGGGPAVDAVRDFTRLHTLDEEDAHWLALRAVAMNAHLLARLLPGTPVVADPGGFSNGWAILDGHAFALADEARPGHLPHTWAATSDALAARAARVASARRLVLLKSIPIPADMPWMEASRRGWVDTVFPSIVEGELLVTGINFRDVLC
jgi:aspartokinase-like uncharacterized kinase